MSYCFLVQSHLPDKSRFLALEVFAGHTIARVWNALRESQTFTSFIPEGCPGFIQPLKTTVHEIFESKITDVLDVGLDGVKVCWDQGTFYHQIVEC